MAADVDGECVYRPGTYAVTYAFDETPRPPCQALQMWTDESVTVTTDISLTNLGYEPEDGTCADSNLVASGCNVSFDRFCELELANRRVLLFATFEYDYATSTGHGTLGVSIFQSTSDDASLLGECSPSVTVRLSRM